MFRYICRQLTVALFLLPALLLPAGAGEAASKDSLLARLEGHWVLTGTIEGQSTVHDVVADWVLKGYLRLHEVSREKAADGTPAYEAYVYLARQPGPDRYVCFWLDNSVISGPDSPGTAEPQADRMVFSFSRGSFLNTMIWQAETGRWKWLMEAVSGDKHSVFADLTLVRAK